MKPILSTIAFLFFASHAVVADGVVNVADHGIVPGKGLVKLENCRLEHMADDGINVHGAYIKINEQSVSITVADVPKDLPGGPLPLENLAWYPDVEMKNNVIRENRARGALISTKGKVLIEINVFSTQMHGILIEGDNKSWYESGGVRDITITNNVFENIGYGTGEDYPLYVSPMLLPEQRLGGDQYHRNIQFTNNRLKSYNRLLAYARSVKGLLISGDTIELSSDYPTGSELPSIELDHCKLVTIKSNRFIGFDRPLRIEQTDDNAEVVIEGNQGITE